MRMAAGSIVIIGAGHAGIQLAASIREEGFQEAVLVLSDELDLPYQRPQLSKAFLKTTDADSLPLRADQFYGENRIDLRLGEVATSIDRYARRIALRSGRAVEYSHLILACGARPRPFEAPGAALEGVAILRRLSDAQSLRDQLTAAKQVVVIGAGFIGLEVAATAAGLGKSVTIVELGARVMGRAVSPTTSSFFAAAHEAFGARIFLNTGVAALHGRLGRVSQVELSDGRLLPADLVVVGVGILPQDALALAAGLECADGVIVDEVLRSSDKSISAIGDCAAFQSHLVDAPIRLESVQNAVDQARCVARRLVGKAERYAALPWFWSDQGDLKLQIAGLSHGVDQWITRGDPEGRSFAVFGFRAGVLIAVETVNRTGDHMAARKLLEGSSRLSPAEAADLNFDLRRRALVTARPS
jgi:3-phenylpropionate/trans-cinnamate dioxygenase ferredoxin reductase component